MSSLSKVDNSELLDVIKSIKIESLEMYITPFFLVKSTNEKLINHFQEHCLRIRNQLKSFGEDISGCIKKYQSDIVGENFEDFNINSFDTQYVKNIKAKNKAMIQHYKEYYDEVIHDIVEYLRSIKKRCEQFDLVNDLILNKKMFCKLNTSNVIFDLESNIRYTFADNFIYLNRIKIHILDKISYIKNIPQSFPSGAMADIREFYEGIINFGVENYNNGFYKISDREDEIFMFFDHPRSILATNNVKLPNSDCVDDVSKWLNESVNILENCCSNGSKSKSNIDTDCEKRRIVGMIYLARYFFGKTYDPSSFIPTSQESIKKVNLKKQRFVNQTYHELGISRKLAANGLVNKPVKSFFDNYDVPVSLLNSIKFEYNPYDMLYLIQDALSLLYKICIVDCMSGADAKACTQPTNADEFNGVWFAAVYLADIPDLENYLNFITKWISLPIIKSNFRSAFTHFAASVVYLDNLA